MGSRLKIQRKDIFTDLENRRTRQEHFVTSSRCADPGALTLFSGVGANTYYWNVFLANLKESRADWGPAEAIAKETINDKDFSGTSTMHDAF